MTTKADQPTEAKDSPTNECPSTADEMTTMMEKCGCGPMMAKMMAACMGSGRAVEPEGAERGDRNG